MALPTLLNSRSPLAAPAAQRELLAALPLARSFEEAVATAQTPPLAAASVDVLQVNLGKRCNQACHHCHVDAGPDRREVMPDAVAEACLSVLARSGIQTLDIRAVRRCIRASATSSSGPAGWVPRHRSLQPHDHDVAQLQRSAFLARRGGLAAVAASMTIASDGVFEQPIAALRELTRPATASGQRLVLNPSRTPWARSCRPRRPRSNATGRELQRQHGLVFNQLFTITNMPISRYLEWLEHSGNLAAYMDKLVQAFNPAAVPGVMCRNTLSVSWDGRLFDCDFNQMLDLPLVNAAPQSILDLTDDAALARVVTRPIVTGPHCFGCTAGAGSSCGGATV
jgi:hypothetical protein